MITIAPDIIRIYAIFYLFIHITIYLFIYLLLFRDAKKGDDNDTKKHEYVHEK